MTVKQLPLSVKRLEKYLPHRPPMRWIDEVLSVSDNTGICRVIVDKDAHYCNSTGQIRQTAFIEWMAQAYGYIRAAQVELGMLEIDHLPKQTFLAQVRDAEFPREVLVKDHEFFYVHTECLKILGPLSLVKASVLDANEQEVAQCQLKLFAN
jgi:predicted hotdog family 3-hydroxylacyl-ACP dehydratase